MIGTRLAYVALVAGDVERVATALSRDLGLPGAEVVAAGSPRPVPLFTVGGSALALFEPGDPFLGDEARPGVHHLALEVVDLEGAAREARAAGLAGAGAPGPGLDGVRRLPLDPLGAAGVRVWLTEPVAAPPPTPSWIQRIDHVGIASADNAAALDVFCRRLGHPLESTQTDVELRVAVETFTSDRYGVVTHSRAPELVGGLRVAFVTVGGVDLEFLQDLSAEREAESAASGPGTTRGDRSAIARFVASRGPGLHHLALGVADTDAGLARLAQAGHTLLDRAGRPGSRRARIAFLHPRTLGGILVHLVQRDRA